MQACNRTKSISLLPMCLPRISGRTKDLQGNSNSFPTRWNGGRGSVRDRQSGPLSGHGAEHRLFRFRKPLPRFSGYMLRNISFIETNILLPQTKPCFKFSVIHNPDYDIFIFISTFSYVHHGGLLMFNKFRQFVPACCPLYSPHEHNRH